MDELAVDRNARRGHHPGHSDGLWIGDLRDLDLTPELRSSFPDHGVGRFASLAARARYLDSFHEDVLSEDQIEEEADGEDSAAQDTDEEGD